MKFVPKTLTHTADISRGKLTLKGWLSGALSAVVIIGVIYLGAGLATDLIVTNLSETTEARWFAWMYQGASKSLDHDARSQDIFEQLIAAAELRPLPYHLFSLDIDLPNAVALPGGGVGVTTSLLEQVKSDIGLATVLAHELGHHQHRHGLKRFGRVLLWKLLLSFVLGGTDISGLDLALNVTAASYSREQEREADRFGLTLVHQLYGHTNGALEFFEFIQQEHGRSQSSWSALLSSHPLTAERLADLRQLQHDLHQRQ